MYWSNTCCSHPRKGEQMTDAIQRRLFQELRIRSELQYLYKFLYTAPYGDAGSERELCWVYAGSSDDRVRANRTEVADWRFVPAEELEYELASFPEQFTPWFKLEWPVVRSRYFGNSRQEPVFRTEDFPSSSGARGR
jgi:isopentenyl-diphosphate delta-isomerase